MHLNKPKFESLSTPAVLIAAMLSSARRINNSPDYTFSMFHTHTPRVEDGKPVVLVDLGGAMLADIGDLPRTAFVSFHDRLTDVPSEIQAKLEFIDALRDCGEHFSVENLDQKHSAAFPNLLYRMPKTQLRSIVAAALHAAGEGYSPERFTSHMEKYFETLQNSFQIYQNLFYYDA